MERINQRLVNWASILDEHAREQAISTSTLPFIHPHVALMPDAHPGKGATVGSVIPTLGTIIPAAVGVDIGCGMIAVRTRFTAADLPADRQKVRTAIERAVPLSAGAENRSIVPTAAPRVAELAEAAARAGFDPASYTRRWRRQLGSLGSGNHFIEISRDEQDRVWTFLHSGSRGVGNKIAQHHITVAADGARRSGTELPHRDLAYLVEGTEEFARYLRELRWAQRYALLNREEMMDRVIRQVSAWVGKPVAEQERINCHHNFTESERHFDEQVWVCRKGAIRATDGEPGLIPGSMGTASYVVEGKGNPVALDSAPHGAGRSHSRSAARKRFTREQLRETMAGIEYRDTEAFLDEIPAAYKPIDQVMADASDLVRVRHVLRQIVNVKGN